MYRPTFAIDSIGRNDSTSLDLAREHMQALCDCLVSINRSYLKRRRYPDIFAAGVGYDEDAPPNGSVCGDDDWSDIEVVMRRKKGDCDDLACVRAAQLQASGINARAIAMLKRSPEAHDYHIVVLWPPGLRKYPPTVFRDPSGSGLLLEDPSRVLGMR